MGSVSVGGPGHVRCGSGVRAGCGRPRERSGLAEVGGAVGEAGVLLNVTTKRNTQHHFVGAGPGSERLPLAELGGDLATAWAWACGGQRLAAAVVPPELGHPPQQDGHAGHAGQSARPHGELRARRWPRPRPVSASPRRGPPATTAKNVPDSRPWRCSGTARCCTAWRNTAETTSAAPARASRVSPIHSTGMTRTAAMVTPQITTQAAMARPWWRTRLHQPVKSDPTSAPAPGAA